MGDYIGFALAPFLPLSFFVDVAAVAVLPYAQFRAANKRPSPSVVVTKVPSPPSPSLGSVCVYSLGQAPGFSVVVVVAVAP